MSTLPAPRSIAAMQADAAQQQIALTARQFLSVGDLAKRWQVSENTVRSIARTALPYMELGNGLRFRRRRSRAEVVLAYEDAGRAAR